MFCMDYAVLDREGEGTGAEEEGKWKVLAMKDVSTKMLIARVVPCKGTSKPYCWKRVVKDLDMIGRTKVVMRTDGEPAITDLVAAVKRNRQHETIPEKAPKGDPRANGQAENGVRLVKERFRVVKAALRKRLGGDIPKDSHAMAWLIEHGATTYSLYKIGQDGKTPYERVTGRKWKQEAFEFGEQVMYRLPEKSGGKKHDFEDKWAVGTYLGIVRGSYERIVGTKEGVWRTNAVKRKPFEERWVLEKVAEVRGLPWEPKVGEDTLERPTAEVTVEAPRRDCGPSPADTMPRAFKITANILQKYKRTEGCAGCRGTGSHTSMCRARLRKDMEDDEFDKERIENETRRLAKRVKTAVEAPEQEGQTSASSSSGGMDTAANQSASGRNEGDVAMEEAQEHVRDVNVEGDESKKRGREDEGEQDGKRVKANEDQEMMYLGPAMNDMEMMALTAVWEKLGEPKADISEIYSPPRVTKRAQEMGMRPGMAFDLTVNDENGVPWDFAKKERREAARERLRKERPWLLVGSPMCTAFSLLQNLNYAKMDPKDVKRKIAEALVHVHFCLSLYREQMEGGRYFLHEHPASATSWRDEKVMRMRDDPRVSCVVGHMCAQEMLAKDAEGIGLVYKPTRWMTNSECVARRVGKRCVNEKNVDKSSWHRHVHLVGGRAGAAQVYPKALCTEIVKGLKDQLIRDGAIGHRDEGTVCCMEEMVPEEWLDDRKAWDDISGKELNLKKVVAARQEELGFFDKLEVGTVADVSECWQVTGKRPISVKWIDCNRGDEDDEDYRSRLVARDFKDETDSMFAATPPLEALKYLISMAASQRGSSGKVRKLMFLDVRRAYFNAKINTPTYVELPPERAEAGKCWRLNRALYGTRPAAQSWEEEYGSRMLEWGFEMGKTGPCLFHHKQKNLKTVIHGDDFTILGEEEELKWFKGKMEGVYEIKDKGTLGPEANDQKEVRVLNRVIEWKDDMIIIEADQRHAELIIKDMGVKGGRAAKIPGEKEKMDPEGEDDEELQGEEATTYRRIAARANYLAADRMDIQFSVKEICRKMSKPCRGDWQKLKKLARYLEGRPRLQIQYMHQMKPKCLEVLVDSDHAGCRRTRKSTNGGVLRHGRHTLRTWSSTQSVVALSSGESEYYALVKGASVALGARSMCGDLGEDYGLKVHTDSNAAKGMANRAGLSSKTRHMDVHYLWVQSKVRAKEFELLKIDGKKNMADLMTKYLTRDEVDKHVSSLGGENLEGRHKHSLAV